ncbi:MAG: hypothetical protein ACO3S4_11475, partial [Pseudohongiellaceae bacterium]
SSPAFQLVRQAGLERHSLRNTCCPSQSKSGLEKASWLLDAPESPNKLVTMRGNIVLNLTEFTGIFAREPISLTGQVDNTV